eukprot:gene4885-8479_t
MNKYSKTELEKHFCFPKAYAATLLGISITELTKLCKEYGIERWPYHHRSNYLSDEPTPFTKFSIDKKRNESVQLKKSNKGELNYILDKKSDKTISNFVYSFEFTEAIHHKNQKETENEKEIEKK